MADFDEPLHLALMLNAREHWTRGIARGAVRAVRAAAEWAPFFIDAPEMIAEKLQAPRLGRRWAGVIGSFYPAQHPLLLQLRAAGVPVVNVSSAVPPAGVMWIHNDDCACGALAAQHFLERGHRHFAFLGISEAAFSAARRSGFAETLAAAGFPEVREVDPEPGADGPNHQGLANELRELPKPCAVFACNDVRAGHCLRAAQLAGIAVPEQLAILGVDDDDLYCNMAPVALSSVCPDWERIGERAVEQLVKARATGRGHRHRESIAPLGVQTRQSSDALAVEDPLAARALKRIRDHRKGLLTPDALAAQLGVSRRNLERRLLRAVGKTLHAAFTDARLQRVYRMVVQSRMPVGEIAEQTGFSKHSHLNAAFKERFGRTPTQVRKGAASRG